MVADVTGLESMVVAVLDVWLLCGSIDGSGDEGLLGSMVAMVETLVIESRVIVLGGSLRASGVAC